ncbi:MAG: hypothetical protein HXX13_11810 [Bacteroidetes bacterium]|nr:hypothetical protein [Bacteroidota bacterium]
MNRKLINFILLQALFVGMLAISSCKKDKASPELGTDYFPLQVGNSWKLQYSSLRQITGTIHLGGYEYYSMVSGNDTSYLREGLSTIWIRTSNGEESPLFKLTANLKDYWYWTDSKNGMQWKITLNSKLETVKINGQTISNCYSYYFDNPEMADEEYYVYLAPGIGYVQEKCGFCIDTQNQLESATINGVKITF